MFIATLIADGTLDERLLTEWARRFEADWTAGTLTAVSWIDEGYAADLTFAPTGSFGQADAAHLAEGLSDLAARIAAALQAPGSFDVVVQAQATREKRLLIADMDSTMITVECIDELADYAGIKPQIAAITEAAMRGELDFEGALDARVALLEGLDEGVIARCLAERVRIMPGAKALVRTMCARGGTAVLVSGGFTRFAEPVAAEIGFDRAVANVLEVADGRLTGTVARPIVGAETKERMLLETIATLGIDPALTLAVGDGANDLPMIRRAGLGVAYHATPIVAAEAAARIDRGDLSALLYAQGIPRREWVTE